MIFAETIFTKPAVRCRCCPTSASLACPQRNGSYDRSRVRFGSRAGRGDQQSGGLCRRGRACDARAHRAEPIHAKRFHHCRGRTGNGHRESGGAVSRNWPAGALQPPARLQASIESNTRHCAICSESAAGSRKILDLVVAAKFYKIDRRSPHSHLLSIHGVRIMRYECGNSRIVITNQFEQYFRPHSPGSAARTGLYLQL